MWHKNERSIAWSFFPLSQTDLARVKPDKIDTISTMVRRPTKLDTKPI